MKEFMKDWAEMNKRQIKEMSENFIENLRYMKNEYESAKQTFESLRNSNTQKD